MKNRIPALFLALLTGTGLFAQSTDSLFTLQSCLRFALEHNPSSTIYMNEAEIAQQKARQTLAAYLPQVNGTVTSDDNLKRATTIIPAGAFSPTEIRMQMGTQYSTNASVQLDQTIYDQGMFYASAANKANNAIADLNIMKNNENIIYNTTSAYYDVLIYTEQAKLLALNEQKYTELLDVLKLQYDKGAAKKVDYDRVRVSLNNIRSQQALVETNKALALNRLKNAIGLPLESKLVIMDSLNYQTQITMPAQNPVFDFHSLLDYRIQTQNLRLIDLNMRRIRGSFAPTLSFYARYGAQSYGNNFSSSFSNWFDYSVVGIKLNVPIFSGMRRNSQLLQSRYELTNAQLNLKISEDKMRLNHLNSWTQLMSSYTSLSTNRENLELAREVFDITSLQYQKGAAPLSDFLNSDYAYKEAQANYITSLLNFLSARLDYERSQGTLNEYVKKF